MKLTKEQRYTQFDNLYRSIEGRGPDRIRKICSILHCEPNTVRVWRVRTMTRPIPEAKLKILSTSLKG